jgi:hypothetical protein
MGENFQNVVPQTAQISKDMDRGVLFLPYRNFATSALRFANPSSMPSARKACCCAVIAGPVLSVSSSGHPSRLPSLDKVPLEPAAAEQLLNPICP